MRSIISASWHVRSAVLLLLLGATAPLLAFPHATDAAVAVDSAANSPNLAGTGEHTWSHTVSGSNTYLVVGLSGWDAGTDFNGAGDVTVTFNGDIMTSIGFTTTGGSGEDTAGLWGLVNPDAGTHTVSVTNGADIDELGGGSVSFTGVNQSTSVGTFVGESAATSDGSIDITLATGDLGIDTLYCNNSEATAGGGQTPRVSVNSAGTTWHQMSTEGGTGTVTMSWSCIGGDDAIGAIPIKGLDLPGAPTNLTATKNGANVNLAWTAPLSDPGIDSYKVYRDTGSPAAVLLDTITGAATTSATYVDTAPPTGHRYYYRIIATNANGDSAYSNEASVNIGRFSIGKTPNNLGQVGYWSFNEGTGDIAGDFSGNGNHGALTLFCCTEPPQWTNGKRGKGLFFNGSDAYIDLGAPASLNFEGRTAMTVAAWARLTDVNQNWPEIFTKMDDGNGAQYSFRFGSATDRTPVFQLSSVGSVGASEALQANRWYHLVGVFNGTDIRLYIDGALDSTSEDGGTISGHSGDIVHIGMANGTLFKGDLDEIRVYNRALSSGEVAKLYSSGAVRINASSADLDNGSSLESGLVGHWTFDGGATNWTSDTVGTTSDKSGNGNDGGIFSMNRRTSVDGGMLGQAFLFDGADDWVSAGTSGDILDGATAASICLWLKHSGTTVSQDGSLVSRYQVAANGPLLFWVDNVAAVSGRTDTLSFLVDVDAVAGGDSRVEGSTGLVTPGVWSHFCATYQGGSFMRIYKNAVLDQENTTSINASIATTATIPTTMGNDPPGNSRPLPGRLDDVRIYNRALSVDEIRQLYNLGTVTVRKQQ